MTLQSNLKESDKAYISKQEQMLEDVIKVIKDIPNHNLMTLIEIEKNIKDLKEESKSCKEDDLPGIIQQINLQNQLAQKLVEGEQLPDVSAPYFGHMKIHQDGKEKDLFLSHVSLVNRSLSFKIIDWKKAPIARIFYQFAEQDEFDFDVDHRTIEGTILEKSVLTIREGELLRVDRLGTSFVKRDGVWLNLNEEMQLLQGGEGKANSELHFGSGKTNFDSPEVISLLDKIQYEIINMPHDKPLLITGGAGSGKTTVALYRLAKLCEKGEIRANEALVLVPNSGLIKLSENLLSSIGLDKTHVKANDFLIKELVFNNLPRMPRKVNYESPLSVVTIKRSSQMKVLIDKYIQSETDRIHHELKRIGENKLTAIYDRYADYPLIPRLREVHKNESLTALERIAVQKLGLSLKNYIFDIFSIYTNKSLLELLPDLSEGKLNSRMCQELFEYSSKHMKKFDEELDYVEDQKRSRLKSGYLDFEDLPILVYLVERKLGNFYLDNRNTKLYKHVFLDEAQELSDLELNAISKVIEKDGSVTIAGDAVQQIDPSFEFNSWENVMKQLGHNYHDPKELNVSYRSPVEIVKFAHTVLGPLAPDKMPESKRKGGPILQTQVQHRAHASMILSDALVDLTRREPNANIAIICNKEDTASMFFNELEDIGGVRLVLEQEFSFKPGIDITTVDQIRGLEFDYVIIPDLDRINYPENNRARKRLHLAATRAIHQLWILYPQERSILF